jgi:hypothetical protein
MSCHHSLAEIREALEATHGAVYLAAEQLQLSPQALYARIKKSTELTALRESFRGRLLDTAEVKLEAAVEAGDLSAIKYVLSTLGKDRGYVQKQEVETNGHLELEIQEKTGPELNQEIRRILGVMEPRGHDSSSSRGGTPPPGLPPTH